MYFTLAVSAASAEGCAALTRRALATDAALMPVPGPAAVAWRSGDGRAALLCWGAVSGSCPGPPGSPGPLPLVSRNGTIWVDEDGSLVRARTSITRVDPVYTAEVPGAIVVSDRAMWAADVAERLGDPDPSHVGALLSCGYPLGSATGWRGVSALAPATSVSYAGARGHETPFAGFTGGGTPAAAGAARVAAALVDAVAPLRSAGQPVRLSLTGGKDSRLIAAALVKAGVEVQASTHGFAEHPDVPVATEVARLLGIEHTVTAPAAPGQKTDVAGRLRATALVADGMLSAFENVGRPDPRRSPALTAGGHGGELLRGGYAEAPAGRRAAVLRGAETLRRLTTARLGLLRKGAAAGYAASLAPWTGSALSRGPLRALDDFYLVNRAGRWSAAARQAYLIRERLAQPLFDERVVRAARTVPLADRVSGALATAVLAELNPALAGLPYAGKPARGTVPKAFDWRRQYGDEITRFLRSYALDLGASGGLFDVVSRAAAEKVLAPPHDDRVAVWALATLACLLSGDYRNARGPAELLPVS
jgi:hypothetical protein